ncbi:MAG TPA: arsenosugar biosynthesis radical SAM protein ArsS, partial [Verrucomicrobiae bacterium]|nr:arsenosugar biosynthesis radical SAM protein ArsS [Verrucomicrobiae bacterium]
MKTARTKNRLPGITMQSFVEKLSGSGQSLKRRAVDVLQVNLGRYCNLACIHCHVESGPTRKEMTSRDNVEAVLRFLAHTEIPTLDITGGA